ncbi:transposase family protein [Streptomyces fulvorobeus]|nr:transposase family protein [Streptomyces fulvorobeus]
MPDPRGRKGRIYPFSALVCAVAAAVLPGAKSLAAIGEWITDAPPWALRTLGFTPDPFTGQTSAPHPATIRRLLERLDGDALDRAVGAFLDTRSATSATVDGPVARAIRRAVGGHRQNAAAVAAAVDTLARDHSRLLCSLHAGGRQQRARHHRRSAWGARGIS